MDVEKMERAGKGDVLKAAFGAVNLSFLAFQSVSGKNLSYEFEWKYLVISVVLIFVMVKMIPSTTGYENTWVFVLGAVTFLPVNMKLACYLKEMFLEFNNIVVNTIWIIIIMFMLLSVEEIAMGIVARIIWRKQVDVVLVEPENYLAMCKENDEMNYDEYEDEF